MPEARLQRTRDAYDQDEALRRRRLEEWPRETRIFPWAATAGVVQWLAYSAWTIPRDLDTDTL